MHTILNAKRSTLQKAKSRKGKHTSISLSRRVIPYSSSPHPAIQRKPNCACGGGCPRCIEEYNELIQTNLKINVPNDPYEKEADRIADQVVNLLTNHRNDLQDNLNKNAHSSKKDNLNTSPQSSVSSLNLSEVQKQSGKSKSDLEANQQKTYILQRTPRDKQQRQTRTRRICGPDITTSLTAMLGTVEPWFRGLSTFQKRRSCLALGPLAPFVFVNPIMAWDTRQLFLPNTGWLNSYFRQHSCGVPRHPRCPGDRTRHLCETRGSCGNSVMVGGRCMLAGTANYALFGKMCKICHDSTGQWGRWDMRAIIGAYKLLSTDDSTPPKEVASASYDGTFPTTPASAENRRSCTGRCGQTYNGTFTFIWEPYRSR
jgi:hypothetical protein